MIYNKMIFEYYGSLVEVLNQTENGINFISIHTQPYYNRECFK